jgi:hypothetical protein
MPRHRRRRWHVRLADCSFFPYPHHGCWTNVVRCSTLSGAMRHVDRNLAQGRSVVLEKWNPVPGRSPKKKPHQRLFRFRCYLFEP